MKWSTDFQLWWWVKVEKLDGLISICTLICRHIVTHSGYQEPRSGVKKVRSHAEWMKMGCQVLITPQHHSWSPQRQSTCNGRGSWIADGSWWVRIQVVFSGRSMSQLLIRQKRCWIPFFYLFLSGIWVVRLFFDTIDLSILHQRIMDSLISPGEFQSDDLQGFVSLSRRIWQGDYASALQIYSYVGGAK